MNVCILSVRSQILLINLKFEKLNSIEVQLDVLIMLSNGKLFHFVISAYMSTLKLGQNLDRINARTVNLSISSSIPELEVQM
jgi:hypothetical protein